MPALIRPATHHDLDQIIELENLCFATDKMQRRQYRALLNKSSAVILIAEHKKKLIGCLLVLFRKNSLRARIYSIAVHPAHRHTGVARQLLTTMEKEILHRGCNLIILEVRTDNIAAIRFYEKNGYETFGSYSKFYEDGTDALRMKKGIYDEQGSSIHTPHCSPRYRR